MNWRSGLDILLNGSMGRLNAAERTALAAYLHGPRPSGTLVTFEDSRVIPWPPTAPPALPGEEMVLNPTWRTAHASHKVLGAYMAALLLAITGLAWGQGGRYPVLGIVLSLLLLGLLRAALLVTGLSVPRAFATPGRVRFEGFLARAGFRADRDLAVVVWFTDQNRWQGVVLRMISPDGARRQLWMTRPTFDEFAALWRLPAAPEPPAA